MAYDAKTERLISIKKLSGKAQTSNDKGLSNEALPSGITSTSETIFGETVTTTPSSTALYTITGKVEYIRFPVSFIAGSDTSDGRHGFELKLPSDYESNSSNSKKGTFPFLNNQSINITSGSLQLVPPSFATTYEAKPFYGGTAASGSGTQIPLLDARDWYLDYFNGIFFQQDPPGTGDHANNPDYIEAFLYIGDKLSEVVASSGGTPANPANSVQFNNGGSFGGDSNFTFNSTTDTVTVVNVTASGHVSASTFYGDGSNLTGINAGISYSRRAVTSTITASINDTILGVTAGSSLEIRLPSAADYSAGQYFTIKDEGGNANTNNITVITSGSQTIDGQTSIILESPYAAVNLYSDGTSKFFIY
jgi:hypothetical protein